MPKTCHTVISTLSRFQTCYVDRMGKVVVWCNINMVPRLKFVGNVSDILIVFFLNVMEISCFNG